MIRTSTTHPLRIDTLQVANGQLGITFCPGKLGDSVFGNPWARDIDLELDAVEPWGANAVVTLLEPHEFEMLAVPNLGHAVKARNIAWYHFPIKDLGVPSSEAMNQWWSLGPKLHHILERGGRVLVHCRGGLGRAGMIAALMLVEHAQSAPAAMDTVRATRPGAIETKEQERWLVEEARHFGPAVVRLHSCLLGAAIGDSLGAKIEFLSLAEIRRRFPKGVTDLPRHHGLRGAITDDTQMTLFTAEGLIRAYIRGSLKGICHVPSVVHHALLRWHRTQGGAPRAETDTIGLITDQRLWARRAPGNICLSALARSKNFGALA